MIWNQVQDLKGLKVYDVKKAVVASHLSYRDLWAVMASHVLCCLSFPRATSAISLSSLEQIREQSGSLSPTIQQHWQGDAAILWYWEHPWYAKSMNFKPEKPSEVPQVGDSISGPASHHFEAPGHRFPWRPPRRLSRAKALQPRRGRWLPPCGAACGLRRLSRGRDSEDADGRGDDESWTKLSSVPVQPTNERWMFLDSTSSKLFKAKKQSQTITNTLNKFQYIYINYNITIHYRWWNDM